MVNSFPQTTEVTGSNHSSVVNHEFSYRLIVRIFPSAFSLPSFMYLA